MRYASADEVMRALRDVDFPASKDELVRAAEAAQAGSLFNVTSIRRGFTGGGETGKQGLASRLALAASIPGAKSIPRNSPVFLGFATTIQSAESSIPVSNFETLPGWTDQWPSGYFKQGTIMPLSHLFQDLAAWYGCGRQGSQDFPAYADRARSMFRPGLSLAPGSVTADPPTESETDIFRDIQSIRRMAIMGACSR
jgi:hypothetical protein